MLQPPRALASYFSHSTRDKGDAYAAGGRVRLVKLEPQRLDAAVDGTERYLVRVELETGAPTLTVSLGCSCPYFDEHLRPCKHLWATLVKASAANWEGASVIAAEPPDSLEVVPIPISDLTQHAYEPVTRGPSAAPSPGDLFLKGLDTHLSITESAQHAYRTLTGELIYLLDVPTTQRQGHIALEIATRKRKRDGSWSRPQTARIIPADIAQASPADAEVLAAICGANAYPAWQAIYTLNDALSRVVVPAATKTNRLHLRENLQAALAGPLGWDGGPPWLFRVTADRTESGFRLGGHFERGEESIELSDHVVAVASGFLFTHQKAARVDWRGTFGVYSNLMRLGTVDVPDAQAARLAGLLARNNVPVADLPRDLQLDAVAAPPQPFLHLRSIQDWRMAGQLRADVRFDYDGTALEPGAVAVEWDAARSRLIRRDLQAEAAALTQLAEAGISGRFDTYTREEVRTISAAAMPAAVRDLAAHGWIIEADGRRFESAGAVRMSVRASTDIDWFDLQGTVDFGETSLPLPEVLAALERGESTIRLGESSVGLLPEDWLRRYAPLAAWGDVDGDRVRFRRTQTALLDALLMAQEEATSVTIDERFEAARQELRRFERIEPLDPPASFHGELRGYQREGLGWMLFLRRFGFGGCLADDMGLGKTVMVLALLEWWRVVGSDLELQHLPVVAPNVAIQDLTPRPPGPPRPSLVVVPRSLVQNWMLEAARFAPELRVLDYSHVKRAEADASFDAFDLVLITYGTLRRDITHLNQHRFEYVILDEAQSIKNATTASAKAARLLNGRYRLALSGTPIENHLGELWSLFEFLNPGMLGAMSVFQKTGSASRNVAPETAELLSRALRPFILRRTKQQVAPELPARTEQTITCELEGKQRAFYDTLRTHYRQALLGRIDEVGLGRSKIQILEALLRLRQAACHPALVDAGYHSAGSAKLDLLIPKLTEVAEEGHKALVFSQFTSFLALLRARLDQDRVVYEYLDGETTDRQTHVDRFQTDPDCRLFLISLKAGGLGLNLTAADYVFLLDPWWNPAVEAQAIDRTHRIGQTRHVFAYRLIAGDTVEEKVLALQQTKRELADAILRADAGLVGQLKREDLEILLS